MKTKNRYWIDYLVLALIVVVAVGLRVAWQYKFIFVGDNVIFREADPFLHMRLAEVIASNFPHSIHVDMYALYPAGAVTYSPVLDYITATISWVIGLGYPSMHLVDTVGAFLPVFLMAVVCVVVYFIGRLIFNSRVAGLIAALLISILPSELFHRSMLGFTDHHILEVVLVTTGLLLLILGIQRRHYAWYLGSILVFLIYGLAWIGWPLTIAVISGWFIGYMAVKIWKRHKTKERILLISVLAAGCLMVGLVPFIRGQFMVFLSNTFLGFTGTIAEASPTDLYAYYVLYGLSGFLAIFGIALAIRNKVYSLIIVWGVFFIIAAIAEKRWGYYGVVSIALFTGYLISWISTMVKKDWRGYIVAYFLIILILTTTPYSLGIAKRANDITPDWYNTCQWLRYNTQEPFQSADSYYERNPGQPSYGVFSWWDYGHWIIQVGHRVPICSPTQQESQFYEFFTLSDESEANKVIKDINIKYIILDKLMCNEKYYAIYQKVYGTSEGWQISRGNSYINQMYSGKSSQWEICYQNGDVKVLKRR